LGTAGATLVAACSAPQAQVRTRERLQHLEQALGQDLKAGASSVEVRRILDREGISYERNPMPGELIAYVGEWQGPVFRRGIHMVFYFDKDEALVRYASKEVEGS
jgi:hypothetical protein